MKKVYISFLLMLPLFVFSQGENDNWYFGKLGAINFSTPNPVVLNTSQMGNSQLISEACGTVSDSNGNLLFYTDGVNVWNRNNQIMDNGANLSGHSSTQQLVIIKSLSNPNQYYIFIGGQFNFGSYIKYSIVDMSLGTSVSGQPLGRVLDNYKNILVTDSNGNGFLSEAITVVPSSYGTMWLLIPNGQSLYAYNISSQGFNNGNPIVSALNFPFSLSGQVYGVKASPKLTLNNNFSHYLCISTWDGYPDFVNKVYSFDYDTGKITTDFSLQINSLSSYSPEFNLDSSILYLGRENLYAVDLLSATPTNINYMQLASLNYACGTIQRNKYGDIYVSIANSQYLSKILNPNVYGSGISLDINNIFLGSHISGASMNAGAGLPQLIEKPLNEAISNCIPNRILDSPELHYNYTYRASNTIVAENNYKVFASQNITLKAGNSITLLPNTFIEQGSNFLATIEGCRADETSSKRKANAKQNISLKIDLDSDMIDNNVELYPNPASDFVNINSKFKIKSWEIYDMSGKQILKGNSNKIDVANFIKGVYMINIMFENGKNVSKKVSIK